MSFSNRYFNTQANQYSTRMENPPVDRMLSYLKKNIGYRLIMREANVDRAYLYDLFNVRRNEDEIRRIYDHVVEKLNKVGVIENE